MIDPFGRRVTYLRVSVTDRCNFRCSYCMAEEMTFLPRHELLSLEELDRLCGVFIDLGVRRLRITGGEPLVRRDLMTLFRSLHRQIEAGRLDEVTLTTNGALLARHAAELAACGVRRVNVSLDSLDPDRFRALTRLGSLDDVLVGIAAARRAGIRVRVNAVALRGVNDDEIDRLVAWAGGEGHDVAFIEAMPLGETGPARAEHWMSLAEVRQRLEGRWTLRESEYRTAGPARYVDVLETGSRIGFITPFSHNFCEACNRVRVTCTGTLYLCLGQDAAADLRTPLRSGGGNAVVREAILAAVQRKPRGHDFDAARLADGPRIVRFMNVTGG
ncbi:MAG: GTP 3',8-cyclase MoaA [Gammaproteobacteria bacterium]|jgi:cyclic pyranopterin phosphate synthase|nr:GTP 3',8-cyclase MoaA [Gammaproteobacteria bacterium]